VIGYRLAHRSVCWCALGQYRELHLLTGYVYANSYNSPVNGLKECVTLYRPLLLLLLIVKQLILPVSILKHLIILVESICGLGTEYLVSRYVLGRHW